MNLYPLKRPLLFCLRRFHCAPRSFEILYNVFNFIDHQGEFPLWKRRRSFNHYLFGVKIGRDLGTAFRRRVTDKATGKDFIREQVGGEYVLPTLAVFDSAAACAAYVPPQYPVIAKPTHSSGRWLIARDLDEWRAGQAQFEAWLAHDYYLVSLERNYYGLEKKILVEPFLPDEFVYEGSVHCRGGVPKIVSLIDRSDPAFYKRRSSFGPDWVSLRCALGGQFNDWDLPRPAFLDDLLRVAGVLSRPFEYVRVDFFATPGRCLIGELTSVPAGSHGKFSPEGGEARFSAAFFS